ncbi:hyoscyamine 6-dioxygenase [Paraphaeosphaeria sporulosa]|uniref:Hyoscyamine 6-dioxygenase n=1 Tax=Paraphaeosphaeria sporulosa TaxID=1460663 RepID=A0A177CNK5_9PLEO|nr:hyoscyamine 6-dioxygenase [Paraphaeosphaeria sporulosa]OAG09084.1 hyoscyamine 6-dioxygenase [Paraphaeosphaeria sporulosa]
MVGVGEAPPILDFSAFYTGDAAAKKKLVDDVRSCCLHNGFFQITGHNVPRELQQGIMDWNKKFFDLPLEQKMEVSKDTTNTWNRGYELLKSQILEEGTLPELKEGFYIGDEISKSHPYFINKKLNSGPNMWPSPSTLPEVADFQKTALAYYYQVVDLAKDILKVLAQTLDLEESWFDEFSEGAVATMRLLHYPSQPPDSPQKLTRGIGAHTDFGTITILLQDKVAGLQVLDNQTKEWLDVEPTPGAFVVNLGNLMMRWSNDKYISNTHRVINQSGEERYSIPVFFSGNPDFVVECLPNCRAEGEEAKYAPITVEQAVLGGYADSYGRAERFKKDAAAKASAVPSAQGVAVA